MMAMGTRKKGAELLFNLYWRNKLENGGEKCNIVGMYDTASTTGNFEIFKSYLLKNSGFDKNVKVTFFTDSGTEWEIESQSDFEIALCAFRLKSRLGECIYLKLEKKSNDGEENNTGAIRKHSNDAETQFDSLTSEKTIEPAPEWFLNYMAKFKRDIIEEIASTVATSPASPKTKERDCSSSNTKAAASANVPVVATKRIKHENKRRKLVIGDTIDKELLRNLKFERKLEMKLDKLDAKSMKIKEKKQALINKIDGEEDERKWKKLNPYVKVKPLLKATLLSDTVVPHMIGGELYLHIWDLKNTGKLPWTNKTELRLTWGSADMKPMQNVIKCPLLQPGENGSVCVHFEIPKKPGSYESYWNFYDNDVRFGHWLSCCVIVDGPLAGSWLSKIKQEELQSAQTQTSENQQIQENNTIEETPIHVYEKLQNEDDNNQEPIDCDVIDLSTRIQEMSFMGDLENFAHVPELPKNLFQPSKIFSDFDLDKSPIKYGIQEKDLIVDLSTNKPENKIENTELQTDSVQYLQQDDNNNNKDGDATSDSQSSAESICEIASEASSDISSGYDVINGPHCDDNEVESGYVYITIDGNKLPVPRYYFRPEILANAEQAALVEEEPKPTNVQPQPAEVQQQSTEVKQLPTAADNIAEAKKLQAELEDLEQNLQETKSLLSHCSTAGSCYSDANTTLFKENSRLFMFPQNNPGFELVDSTYLTDNQDFYLCPTNRVEVLPSDPLQTYTWAQSKGHYAMSEGQNLACGVTVPHSKFDPYGPLEQNRARSAEEVSASQNTFTHVPNYQQTASAPNLTPPNQTPTNSPPRHTQTPTNSPPQTQPAQNATAMPNVHILPENLVSGAVNVASSAINTARSVINLIVPPKEPGKWVNGHWVTENHESTRAKNLRTLNEMGFWDTDLNATLLARYKDDIARVISELIQ